MRIIYNIYAVHLYKTLSGNNTILTTISPLHFITLYTVHVQHKSTYPHCNSIKNDIFDVDVMKFEMSAQLFNDSCLATSRWPSNQHSHRLYEHQSKDMQFSNIVSSTGVIIIMITMHVSHRKRR